MAQSQVEIQLVAKDQASGVFKTHAEALRHAQTGYESLGQYMRRTSAEAQNTAKAQQDAANSTKNAGDAADSASSQWGGLFQTFTLANLAASAVERGIQLASDALRNGVQAAANMERQILGLNTAAQSFGVSTDDMNTAVQRLTSDGLLTFGQVANGIKNLLSTGMDIDTAVGLMERFKDEAAFGRAETIKYGDAVVNLSEAFLTGSSQMGNLNGHTANFSDALEIGAAALGKTTAELSKAEEEQAKLIGYMQQGAYTAGNAALYSDTYAGSLSRVESESQKASVSLGQILIPATEYATQSFLSFITGVNGASNGTQDLQAYLVTLAAVVRTVAQTVVGAAQVMYGALKSVMTLSLQPINEGINAAADGFVDTWNDAYKQYERIYSGSADAQLDSVDAMLGDMTRAYDRNAAKRSQQEEDLTRQFQRQMDQRRRSFEESMRDMIIAHRDKSRSLEADIAKENAAYAKSARERKQDYNEDIASLEERHLEKVQDIEDRIAEEREKGLMVDGVLFREANQKKIDELQKQLREDQEKHQKALEKRKAQYAEDVAEDKSRHDEKLAQLQESLSEELAILNRHRSDVAAIGEAQKEDDISRLKRQFSEQNAEAARNFQEQLARARSAGSSQGGAYGGEFLNKIREANGKMLESQRNAANDQANVARDSGSRAGNSWLQGFAQSMENFRNNTSWGKMIQELTKTQDQFVRNIAGFFGIDPNMASRVFTGRATGGVVRQGEVTLVGERGPEIAQFPAGTKIIPADQTKRILSDAQQQSRQVSVNIGTVVNQSNMDPDAFFSSLSWYLR